jgi:hypothetical protein
MGLQIIIWELAIYIMKSIKFSVDNELKFDNDEEIQELMKT